MMQGFMNLLDIVQSDNHIKERHLSRLQIVKEAKEYTLGYKSINDDGQIKATDNTTSEEPGLAKQREKLNSQIDLLKSKLDEVDLWMISEDYIGSQLENKMEEFTRDINLRTQEYNEMKNDTRRMAGEVNKVGLYGTEYMKAEVHTSYRRKSGGNTSIISYEGRERRMITKRTKRAI